MLLRSQKRKYFGEVEHKDNRAYFQKLYIVYILKSLKESDKCYIGLTQDLAQRLKVHNSGDSSYSKKYSPWEIETYITFRSKSLAKKFEKYLKKGSGHSFLKKRFLERC